MSKPVDLEELKRGGVVKLREKDMFSMWVKSACGNMNSRQLRKLADVTDRYARGFLLFTTRQIPIIPHINVRDVVEVKQQLSEVELQLDRCGPRVRGINVCYDGRICADAVVNCLDLAEKLETFFHSPMLHKVKIGVAGCQRDCIITRGLNDIGFVGVQRHGKYGYDAFIGGRLGVNPFLGVKMAECLSEEEAVRLVQNYFDLLEHEGKTGERGADVIGRLGADEVKKVLNKDLDRGTPVRIIKCANRLKEAQTGKVVLRIRATCGEVTSKQLRKIADIADRYGRGFVHFAVRGSPEIPCVDPDDLTAISRELKEADLEIIDRGIDNLQSCFGAYCAEGLMDPQSLLRDIERKVAELDLNNLDIRVSASGCPNSCGIAHLSDIGFHGVVEPEIDAGNCSGCGLCPQVCKRKAITIVNDLAIIDRDKCRYCGQCIAICPYSAIVEKRKGITVLVGGAEGEDTRFGQVIAGFVSPEAALQLAEECLKVVKKRRASVATIVDEVGIESFKEMLNTGAAVRVKGGGAGVAPDRYDTKAK